MSSVMYAGLPVQGECLVFTPFLRLKSECQFPVCVCVPVSKVLFRMWGHKSDYTLHNFPLVPLPELRSASPLKEKTFIILSAGAVL